MYMLWRRARICCFLPVRRSVENYGPRVSRIDEDAKAAGRSFSPAVEALRKQQENAHISLLAHLNQAQG